MDAGGFRVAVDPDDLFLRGDLGEFDLVAMGVVAGDHGMAVGQALNSAGIIDGAAGKVLVGDGPDGFARPGRPR